MNVMVGGTFDMLHIGHKELLSRAFSEAGSDGYVYIGLSSDTFAGRKPHPVHSYEIRKTELETWINRQNFPASYRIDPLNDRFGSALSMDFDILIVSYETLPGGELINRKRRELGQKPVTLVTVPCVCAEDGKAVSTTRIYHGEISQDGKPVS